MATSVPLPPVANTVKLFITSNNVPSAAPVVAQGSNVLHIQYAGPQTFTAADLATVANACLAWYGTHFTVNMNVGWQTISCVATAIDGSGVQGVSTHAPYPGLVSGASLPPSASVCISWLGAPAYRGGKPRTYLVGIPASATPNGGSSLNATYAGNVKSAAFSALEDMTWAAISGNNAALGTVSYIKKALNPTPPYHRPVPLWWPYTGCLVHERLDSQRRRSGKERTFPVV